MTMPEPDGFTRQEMMAIAAGREIRDGEIAIFGVGLAMLAGSPRPSTPRTCAR